MTIDDLRPAFEKPLRETVGGDERGVGGIFLLERLLKPSDLVAVAVHEADEEERHACVVQ